MDINVNKIENSVSKLLENRFFFREFMSIIEANPQLPGNNYFIVWIWETDAILVSLFSRMNEELGIVSPFPRPHYTIILIYLNAVLL